MAWTRDSIATIVKDEKLLIFAKGTREAPRCGFSARAIDVIARLGKPFKVVNILEDPTLRPALVEFSQWPTSPQVFLDGELLGGSDIVQELFESGELQQKVAKSFGDAPAPAPEKPPVSITPEALAKVREFMETANDKLRLHVNVSNGERTYALEIDTYSHAGQDLSYTINGITVVHARAMRPLFNALEVSWVSKDDSEGFAVREVGQAPALPVPFEIKRDELESLLKSDAKAGLESSLKIVDVREDEEWAEGHGEGTIHLALSRLEKEWEQKGLEKSDTIIMVCRSGNRSGQATKAFRDRFGFAKTRNLVGGISNLPLPIIKGA